MQFVDDQIVGMARAKVFIPDGGMSVFGEHPQGRKAIGWPGSFGGVTVKARREKHGGSERVQEHLLPVEPMSPGWIAGPIDAIGIESRPAELLFGHQTVPYQAGLIEDGVEGIPIDRVRGIIFRVEKERDTLCMPRKESKIIAVSGFDPGNPEGPRCSFYSFPFMDDLETAVSLNHGRAQVSR
jgi:hypothetical protein